MSGGAFKAASESGPYARERDDCPHMLVSHDAKIYAWLFTPTTSKKISHGS